MRLALEHRRESLQGMPGSSMLWNVHRTTRQMSVSRPQTRGRQTSADLQGAAGTAGTVLITESVGISFSRQRGQVPVGMSFDS